jgi:uncharacterized membrane protein
LLTQRRILGTLAVAVMAALALGTVDILNDWIGDWGTPLWIAGAFFIPFVVGIAWGAGGLGTAGRVAGALVGAAVVLAPGLGYAIIEDPDLTAQRLPMLWALFTPLAMAQGAITLPVGASVIKRAKP